jgi:hypothetical protein
MNFEVPYSDRICNLKVCDGESFDQQTSNYKTGDCECVGTIVSRLRVKSQRLYVTNSDIANSYELDCIVYGIVLYMVLSWRFEPVVVL